MKRKTKWDFREMRKKGKEDKERKVAEGKVSYEYNLSEKRSRERSMTDSGSNVGGREEIRTAPKTSFAPAAKVLKALSSAEQESKRFVFGVRFLKGTEVQMTRRPSSVH